MMATTIIPVEDRRGSSGAPLDDDSRPGVLAEDFRPISPSSYRVRPAGRHGCHGRPARAWYRTRMPAATRRAYLAWITVCVVWGTTYLAIRIALETIPPMLMAAIRWLVAGTVLIVALR